MNSDQPTPELEPTTSNPAPITPDSVIAESSDSVAAASGAEGKSLTMWIFSIISFVTIADQLTKRWALDALSDVPGRSISVFGDFLRWTLVFNEGGAMGTNLGSSSLYTVIGIVILIVLGFYLWQYRHIAKLAIPLSLIAGGAIGNLIDRFDHGKVVDWIDVNFFDISVMDFHLERWWTFNIADSAISVALVFMLWVSLRPERNRLTLHTEEKSEGHAGEAGDIRQKEA